MAAGSPSSRGGSGCPSRRGGDYYHFEEYVMIDNAQEPCLASLRWLGRLPDLFRHQLVAGILYHHPYHDPHDDPYHELYNPYDNFFMMIHMIILMMIHMMIRNCAGRAPNPWHVQRLLWFPSPFPLSPQPRKGVFQ